MRPQGFGSLGVLVMLLAPHLAFAAKPQILVERFDFYDASIDQRPMMIAAQKRWLHAATERLRQEIDGAGNAAVITGAGPQKLLAAIAQDYEHPSTCRDCALSAARTLGARYVFIGSIHKISDLICYMRGELDDAQSGKVMLVTSTEVKAANKDMWERAAHALAVDVNQKLQSPSS